MGHDNHSLSLGATIMVSTNCPIIGEHVVTIYHYIGFRATLKFQNVKVALNPMYIIFLNFAKSCVLSCLLKFDTLNKKHHAVFEL